MKAYEGKMAWVVKIGEKGQFVIPKEAREMFGFLPGTSVMVLCDSERGIAIPTKEICDKHMANLYNEIVGGEDDNE